MTQPSFNTTSSSTTILSFCAAVLGIIVFVQSLLISSFVGQQNTQLTNAISGGQQQLNFMRQFDQNNSAFLNDVLQYYGQTRDSNVIAILNRAGINLQQPPPGAAPAAPAAAPAPATR
jgi:hypothetical protein